jgi:hypothetical protein
MARSYARAAGQQLMDALGGGQDLIVTVGQWYLDPRTRQFEVPMHVSFNGAFIRTNNYQVAGVLTVLEDGSQPRFSRQTANENYLKVEENLMVLSLTAAGAVVLSDLAREQSSK